MHVETVGTWTESNVMNKMEICKYSDKCQCHCRVRVCVCVCVCVHIYILEFGLLPQDMTLNVGRHSWQNGKCRFASSCVGLPKTVSLYTVFGGHVYVWCVCVCVCVFVSGCKVLV